MQFLVLYAVKRQEGIHEQYKLKTTDTGVLGLVDWDAGTVTPLFEYTTPLEHRHENLRVAFKCGHINGGKLLLPTSTEVLTISVQNWQLENVLSLPEFNDLHHVIALDNELVVCNTGLDNILWIGSEGKVRHAETLLQSDISARYIDVEDFRQVLSTKPHHVHPNYLFLGPEGELFVTCFFQRRAINVANPDDYFPVDVGNPHDGVVWEDRVYFTTTNGHLVVFDANTRHKICDFDLPKVWQENKLLGWCRGLLVAEGRAFIAFSKVRETKAKEFVRWIYQGFESSGTSRIIEIDLITGHPIRELPLPDDEAPIFGLIPLPTEAS